VTKSVNITYVAKLAGVSTATVSYYLNGHFNKMSASTRSKIAQTIKETGYVPNAQARVLSNKATGVVAVLICDIANHWAGEILRGMESVANQGGYQIIVCDTAFDPKSENLCIEKMLSLGVDGFIIQPTGQVRTIRDRLSKAGKPVVFYDCSPFDMKGSWVKTNLYDAFYSSVTECAARGYEDCVILAADSAGARTRLERLQGIMDAASAADMSSSVVSITHETPSQSELAHYFQYNINPSKKTLVVCPHQWALNRIFEALKPCTHLIPSRIGVLGIDNTEWTSLVTPSITTIIEPVHEEGVFAFRALASQLEGNPLSPSCEVLECTTNWQESTL
jgi:LacI family transcriptional regulator, kdg operon repressor